MHFAFALYLVNKPLSAAGISKENAWGWGIVRKINSWPRSKASKATVKFEDITFQPRALSSDTLASQKGVYLFYNPPINF